MKIQSTILKLLRKDSYVPSSAEQIYKQLKEPHLKLGQVQKALSILESENKVQQVNKNYVVNSKKPGFVQGRFQANTKGFGFVINPDGDIFVRSDRVNNALNGDIVECKIVPGRRRKNPEGIITKILDRSLTQIIGRVEIRDNRAWLMPSDRRMRNIFLIDTKEKLSDGQMIVVNITKYPPQGRAELVEILGDENSLKVELEIIIRQHNLRVIWPEEVTKQVEELPTEVREADLEGRKDYRDEFVVTIDGLDAKDFDDAVSVVKKGDNYHLTVHIADVGEYVPEGSPLDEEATIRGNSTYLIDRVLPMFPPKLSNGLASLNPNVDRLTLSVESTITSDGEIESFEIHKGVIKSKARLTYEEVDEALKTKKFEDKQQEKLLLLLAELQQIIEKNRLKRGSLFFETIEPKVKIDKDLNPVDIIIRERSLATSIIEEMMIVTNEIVAGYMKKRKYPVIYRWHEEPADDVLSELEGLLSSFSFPVKELSEPDHKTYQRLIKFAHGRPDKLLINMALIRSMQKARYSATKTSHFGLASKFYCHFTSPIRRYADLIVHRQVKRMLKKDFDFDKDELTGKFQEIAENVSATEVESAAAERESVDLMVAQYMKDQVGEVFEAIVTSITHFGMFIQLPNSAEGLVHINNLKDDYYTFEPEKYLLRGKRTNKVYQLGQVVNAQLTNVTVGERQLDFDIVEK